MNIIRDVNDSTLSLSLEGRLDTTTAPMLESELEKSLEGITKLVLDLEKLEYISSAGLRVVLTAQKLMNKQGEMVVRNVAESVQEVFDITGFTGILNIQ